MTRTAKPDVWATVHAERAALIRDLEALTDDRWEVPSLCAEWTVHDVVAHLIDTARTTRVGFVVAMARARFDFDRQNALGVANHRGRTPAETLARLREVATRTSTPPAPLVSRVVEEVVHGEDVRRPLRLRRDYPADAVEAGLRLQARTSASFGGARELVADVRLAASDVDVTIGHGPEVTGPLLSLLLAVSGRTIALEDLSGHGVPTLTSALAERGSRGV